MYFVQLRIAPKTPKPLTLLSQILNKIKMNISISTKNLTPVA